MMILSGSGGSGRGICEKLLQDDHESGMIGGRMYSRRRCRDEGRPNAMNHLRIRLSDSRPKNLGVEM